MFSNLKRIVLVIIVSLAIGGTASAQNALTQILQPANTAAAPAANTPTDSLGRTTPSGSLFGFLQAAQRGNNSTAAQYLQMSPTRRKSEGEQIVPKLNFVMNNAFTGSIRNVSNQPEGTPQEGVPVDRQKVGVLSSKETEVDLDLVRVTEPGAGKVWLISSDTLAKIPQIYDQVYDQVEEQAKARWVESKLPAVLVKRPFAGLPPWQWLGLLLAVFAAAAVSWVLLALAEFPIRWWARRHGHHDVANWRSVPGAAWLLLGTFIHRILTAYLGLPLLQRHYYVQVASVAGIVGGNWVLWQAVHWLLGRVRNRALAYGHAGTGSLMLLGERVIKAVVVIMAALAIFGVLGFNMTTALAGLGIGGIAIGFGAQQTIANLFGGISVLGDEVIRVGDVCRFGDRTGMVEDIGLRSTRVRTDERTLLAIPNGTVATINVENLSRRDKILFQTKLGFRPETKADHLRYVLSEIRRLLYSHPKIETNSVRVRLIEIASGSLTAEVVCYVLTVDFNEFAAVREDLLLRIMDLVDEAGTSVAMPSQTLYLSRDSGIEKEKASIATKKVADLRDNKKLPFPDFRQDDISSFKGTIEYPQPESAVRNPNSKP
jgi:MscS family membrane protein